MKLGFIVNAAEAERQMKATLSMSQRAIADGVRGALDEAKLGLRDMTRRAFKSSRLPNTWQGKLYGPGSFNPAGHLWSKAPEIMRAFSKGVTIRSSKGIFIAIPTEFAPKTGTNGKKISPSNFPYHVYGSLRFVYRSTGPSLLVADNVRASYDRKTGKLRGFRPATEERRASGKVATVIMFWLVPQVTLDKKIDPEPIIKRAGDGIPTRITNNLDGRRR